MHNKAHQKFIITVLTLFFTVTLFAQKVDSTYHVNLGIGSGYSYYVTSLDMKSLNKHSFTVITRLMWQPEHILRVGVESGYLPLYTLNKSGFQSEFGTTDVDISLRAVPIMLVFAMEFFPGFEMSGGIGGMILYSSVDSFGNKVVSSSWSNSMTFSASWLTPVYNKLHIGGEVKWYNIAKIQDSAFVLQFALKYSLFSY